jgi:hypothetical protein
MAGYPATADGAEVWNTRGPRGRVSRVPAGGLGPQEDLLAEVREHGRTVADIECRLPDL